MQRRSYLRTAGLFGLASTAGCLARFRENRPENVVLPPQEDQIADSEDLAYPAYGEELPSFSLSDPIGDETIRTDDLDRVAVVTAFFAFCPAECALLLRRLAEVQHRTIDSGLIDDVAFLPITFDPERDDADRLEEHGEMVGVDFDVGNWHYLRPADEAKASEVVEESLGIGFERVDGGERGVEGYDFVHSVVTLLANPDGVVERAYRGDDPDVDRIFDDVETVAEAYAG